MPLPGLAFSKTIVVLDRDLAFIVVMGEILERAGYAVVPASSLQNARTLIRELRIDVDLWLIGYEELLRLGHESTGRMPLPAAPVIAVLSESSRPHENLFEAMGIAAVLNKPSDEPFPEQQWLHLVRRLLGDETDRSNYDWEPGHRGG